MPRLFALLALLSVTPGARAQSVRLQLYDHIVGTQLAHNAPLPAGTEVFVVSKTETRAMRLRSGYSEVVEGLPTARRDRLGRGGQTEGTYVPTARAQRVYFVIARLPDGRLFQSYVKTADADWQPGFDAVSGGRLSMGRVTGVVERTLRAALPAPEPSRRTPRRDPAPAPNAGTGTASRGSRAGTGPVLTPDTGNAGFPSLGDTTRADTTGADTVLTAITPLDSLGAMDSLPAGAVRLDEGGDAETARPWLWALLGAAAGAALTALVLVPVYERRLRHQREHLIRLVPDVGTREQAAAERREQAATTREADTVRTEKTLAQIEQLQGLIRTRDAEIQKLRQELARKTW
jgi:hypothetical protein